MCSINLKNEFAFGLMKVDQINNCFLIMARILKKMNDFFPLKFSVSKKAKQSKKPQIPQTNEQNPTNLTKNSNRRPLRHQAESSLCKVCKLVYFPPIVEMDLDIIFQTCHFQGRVELVCFCCSFNKAPYRAGSQAKQRPWRDAIPSFLR